VGLNEVMKLLTRTYAPFWRDFDLKNWGKAHLEPVTYCPSLASRPLPYYFSSTICGFCVKNSTLTINNNFDTIFLPNSINFNKNQQKDSF
jgi:hypothetical protein